MCIIIDTNSLASVFNTNSTKHSEFKPVFDWIFKRNGKIVFGGSKYAGELGKYLGIFGELRRINKAVSIPDAEVDHQEVRVIEELKHTDCNDQHLIGLLIVSKCKLICSLDKEAYDFFTHPTFFKPARNRPKIYSGKGNSDLLRNLNIAAICVPCRNPNNAEKRILEKLFNT